MPDASPAPRSQAEARRRSAERRLARLAWLLDARFRLPWIGVRFGLDALIGLIPGVGDLVTAGVSLYIIHEAGRLGATKRLRGRMLLHVGVDALVGMIPGVGDVADVLYRVNVRNLRLLGVVPGRTGGRGR